MSAYESGFATYIANRCTHSTNNLRTLSMDMGAAR